MIIKKALIRDASVPIGQAAPISLTCLCGQQVWIKLSLQGRINTCETCQRQWDPKGYLIGVD